MIRCGGLGLKENLTCIETWEPRDLEIIDGNLSHLPERTFLSRVAKVNRNECPASIARWLCEKLPSLITPSHRNLFSSLKLHGQYLCSKLYTPLYDPSAGEHYGMVDVQYFLAPDPLYTAFYASKRL